jgi:hypothetical protein
MNYFNAGTDFIMLEDTSTMLIYNKSLVNWGPLSG